MIATIGALAVVTLTFGAQGRAGNVDVEDCAGAERLVTASMNRGTPEPPALPGLLETYQRALVMCPNHPEALNALGDTLERLGRLESAIDAYRRAAEARPGWALPLFGLGDAYQKLGRTADALYSYRKGLELDPSDAETQGRVRELARDDPPGLIDSRSIRELLDPKRGPGVVAQSLAFSESVLPFEFGRADLKAQAHAQIREIAFALIDLLGSPRSFGVLDVAGPPIAELDGHTDSRGNDEYNFALGRQRADAVLALLVREYRIPRARIITRSFGKSRPVCREQTDACHTQNRRVEIRRPNVP